MSRSEQQGADARTGPGTDPASDGTAGETSLSLVPLVEAQPEGGEVTVYVKGFLGRSEQASHFEDWLESHRAAGERLGWGVGAYGLSWPAGRIAAPVPIGAAAKMAWDVYRAVSSVRRFNVVGNVALVVGEELTRLALRFASEYRAAERAAAERAEVLARLLSELTRRHERVRLVAHSLGCRHAIEAVGSLPDAERPHEVHLCAPACREDEVAAALQRLARERCVLYFAPTDLVLRTGFALLSGGGALGTVGASGVYDGLEGVDVSAHFDFWVHGEYKRSFGALAR